MPSKLVWSNRDGRFEIRLAPATYVVRPLRQNGSPFPRPPAPFQVRVSSGHVTHVTISYDTGIR
jgi:hypothetical protein